MISAVHYVSYDSRRRRCVSACLLQTQCFCFLCLLFALCFMSLYCLFYIVRIILFCIYCFCTAFWLTKILNVELDSDLCSIFSLHIKPQRLRSSPQQKSAFSVNLFSLFESLASILLAKQMATKQIAFSTINLRKLCNILLQTLKDLNLKK